MIDTHMHTNISLDGEAEPEQVVKAAIEKKLTHINITDHIDYLYKEDLEKSVANMEKYIATILALKKKYEKEIYIGVGVEITFANEKEKITQAMLKVKGLEYVIQSVHNVKGSDTYYQKHFQGRDKKTVYDEFLNEVYESLFSNYQMDAVGHLTYITRTAPYQDKSLLYKDFKPLIDKIFLRMIEKGLILEFNTATYTPVPAALPSFELAKVFFDLGGTRVTFSSDAHQTKRITEHYDYVANGLKQIGFKGFTIKENNELIVVPF